MGKYRLLCPAPLLSAGLSALVLAVLGWPVPIQPASWVLGGGGGDFPSIAWGLWAISEALPSVPTHFPDVFYPQGARLLIAALPEAVLLTPVTVLAGPVVSFNLLQGLHILLACAAGTALCQRLVSSCSTPGAILGGLAFGLSPVVLSSLHNGNPDVTPVFWMPAAALCAWRIRDGWGWTVLAGLVVGGAAWFSPYVGAMSAFVALSFAPWRSPRAWLAGALALLVAGGFALTVQHTLSDGGAMIAKPPVDVLRPSPGAADLAGWLWPVFRPQPDGWSLHGWFPGVTVVALAVLGWRGGWRWWVLVGCGVLLSLGPVLLLGPNHPFELGGQRLALPGRLLHQLPGLSSLHIQYRLAALAALGLGVLAACGVSRLPSRLHWVAVVAVLAELSVLGQPLLASGPAPSRGACALLSELPRGAVLDLPGERDERRLLAQSCHGMPVAEGLNQPYPHIVRQSLQAGVSGLSALSDLGFRYIVVHSDPSEQVPAPDRARAAALGVAARAQGLIVAEDDAVLVLDLERL